MLNNINKTDLFYDYYAQWITVYKEGAIRKVTMDKYLLTLSWIKRLAPELKVCELSRITYQKLLNDYAKHIPLYQVAFVKILNFFVLCFLTYTKHM